MKKIQTKVLPQDWLQKVSDFDVDSSGFSINTKIIANRLIEFIKEEINSSLLNPLAKSLVLHIVFGNIFFTELYDSVPVELIKAGIGETEEAKGFEFTKKFHSVFIEFIAYKKLNSKGYEFHVKSTNIDDEKKKEILIEIKDFIEAKQDTYSGKHIEIFDIQSRKKSCKTYE